MIEILTLFLGLFSGMQTVELTVEDPVAQVDLQLNGKVVGNISKPPWAAKIDLGDALAPHELIAVARDSAGIELGRVRRWINLELEPLDEDSRRAVAEGDVTAVAISLDDGIELPPVSRMQTWFTAGGKPLSVLRVDQGTADLVIVRDPAAQPFLDLVATLFMLIDLEISPGHGGTFKELWDDTALHDKEAFLASTREALRGRGEISRAQRVAALWDRWNDHLGLGDDVSLRFISPQAAPVSRIATGKQVFNVTRLLPSQENGLLWHSARIRPLHFQPRISDAVAMAGLEAYVGRRRRAVLLLVAGEAMGSSRYTPAAVRAYFEDLGVPLFVWAFDGEGPFLDRMDTAAPPVAGAEVTPRPTNPPADWGAIRTITYATGLEGPKMKPYLRQVEAAATELRQSLRRQRIVWLRGSHPPSRIRISGEVKGVRRAGGACWWNS